MGNSCKECIQLDNKTQLVDYQGEPLVVTSTNHDVPATNVRFCSVPSLTTHIEKVICENQDLKEEEIAGKQLSPCYVKDKKMIYHGQWSNKKPHGRGIVYFDNGAYFKGYFNNGQAECEDGLFVYPDGTYYRGQIRNSQINGEGIFQSSTKSVTYKGNWKSNKPEGYGQQIFQDGNKYFGQFRNGLKHGQGHFTWADGSEYEGQFKEGYMSGYGNYTKNKSYYKGQFQKNKKESENCVMKTEYGKYEGPFINGQMHGKGKFTWDDGKVYVGQFYKSRLHGDGVISYPNGQRVYGQWQNGENILMKKIDGIQS